MSGQPPVALITGCSSGIGAALAAAYHSRGVIVYATARKIDSLNTLPASVNKLSLDVIDQGSCEKAVQHILDEQGRIDILVHNAGAGGNGPLLDWPADDVKKTFEVNLFGAIRLNALVVPRMIEKKSGTIVVMGSSVGDHPTPWCGVYSASKAALNAYADVLAMELSPFGIHVTLVTPSAVVSNFGKVQVDAALAHTTEKSVYWPARKAIVDRCMESQSHSPMPTAQFAERVATATIKSKPPAHMQLGGLPSLYFLWLQTWLPRSVWRPFEAKWFGVTPLAKALK